MRALRVVGLDEDGESVICEDPENGERFTVPADERLRAAARGDLTRLGQVQIEMESQMRPREIQARIRSGASVQQIAESSGIPEHRVERYAYPVLLERRQIAEMAQRAHPVREDGPDVQTLGEVVAHTFGMRGHDYAEADWDSWRGEDGKWVVQLTWQAGRSENLAHWVFHPGAHGGTVAALDDHAADLLDPSPNRPLRTVRPVTELAREALQLDQQERPAEPPTAPAPPEAPVAAAPPLAEAPTLDLDTGAPERPAEPGAPDAEPPAAESAEGATVEEPDDEAARKAEPRRGRKSHPIVPSWEDVLLGVRSHR
ncbi:septation protein SepH [Saccharopolyspora sp. NPDC000359]|uniref:septation protein SepH n=1 Tax=Saccharopolyspora sp. NPDC000359 TaxID=3154251 RepID=UPI00332BAAE6